MFRFIAGQLSAGKCLAIATVISRSGSGPREPGAMLVMTNDGRIQGTVGGGPLEAGTMEAAEAVLIDGSPRLLSFDLSAPELSESGMICGGRIEILVDRLDGGNPCLRKIFFELNRALEAGKRAVLIGSILTEPRRDAPVAGWGCMSGNEFDPGNLDDRCCDADRIGRELEAGAPVLSTLEGVRCFILPLDPPSRVFIAGAGHIGRALAEICRIAGFRTIVIDDREKFANPMRFPDAHEIRVIASYSAVSFDFPGRSAAHASDAIVIATRSHLHDRDALAGALRTRAGYIGMIAGRRKRDIIYRSLIEDGFTAEDLDRVHSPAGLDIGGRTPAEIAVSVAAEFISARSKQTIGKKAS